MQDSEMELKKLDEESARVLRNDQIITRVVDVVRELVENAIDADAKRIQIYLDNYGMKKIEVRDDGHGIATFSLKYVVGGGYTSKSFNTGNLSCGDSYGFRGEALSAICSAGNLSITSKSTEESRALCIEFDALARIKSEANVAHNKGTTVVVTDLFERSPVRCKYLRTEKQLTRQLNEVEHFLKTVSIINHQCHFTLVHDGNAIWSKQSTSKIEQAICSVFGVAVSKQLQKCESIEVRGDEKDNQIADKIELYIPKLPIDKAVFCSTNQMMLIYINRKAVRIREIEKLLEESICSLNTTQGSRKYPVFLLNIKVPSQNVDFNRDLDKQKVYLVHKEEIIEQLKMMLEKAYSTQSKENKEEHSSEQMEANPNAKMINISPIQSIPVTSMSLEEKQKNVVNFLNELPVAEPLNFTRSPSKALLSSPAAVPNTNRPSKTSTTDQVPSPSLVSSKSPSFSAIGQKSPLVDSNSNAIVSSININDRDWIQGRITGKQGSIIESTVLVRANPKPILTDTGLFRSRITSRNVFGCGLPGSGSKCQLGDQGFRSRQISGSSVSSDYETPCKKARYSWHNMQTPEGSQNQPSMGRSINYEPRHISLEKLKNWPTPSKTFAKTNVVYSTIQLSQSSSQAAKIVEKYQNFDLPRLSPAIPSPEPVELPIVGIESRGQPRQTSQVITDFLEQREKLRNGTCGTLGLRSSISLTDIVSRTRDQPCPQSCDTTATNVDADASSLSKVAVIGKLKYESPLYVVKINSILGVLSPSNLLEMEPNLKQKLNVAEDAGANDAELSPDLIHALAIEFSQLACEDYEENEVRRVFACLKNFDEENEEPPMSIDEFL